MGSNSASTSSPIDSFIQFSQSVMAGIDSRDRASIKYKWLLGQIDDLFKETHAIVMDRLDAVIDARSLSEASHAIDTLTAGALDATFRAQGMCDAFSGPGMALNELTARMAQEGSLSPQQVASLSSFTYMLVNREAEVAAMYEFQIVELDELIHSPRTDLQAVKQRATGARQILVDQLADFDAQATKFKQLIKY
jgi:hypothetical protein